jgi:phosphoribosylanthranilate isomerase
MQSRFRPIQGTDLPDLDVLKELNLPIILKTNFAEANLPALFQSTAGYVTYFLLENSDEFTPIDDITNQIETWRHNIQFS